MKSILFSPTHYKHLWLIENQYKVLSKFIPSFIYHIICNNPKDKNDIISLSERNDHTSVTIIDSNPETDISLNHTYAVNYFFNKCLVNSIESSVANLYMPIDSDIVPIRRITEDEIERIYDLGYYGHSKHNEMKIPYLFIGTTILSDWFIKQYGGFERLNFNKDIIGDSGATNFLPEDGMFRNAIDWNNITSYYDCEWRYLEIEGKEFWFQIHDKTWLHLVGGSRQGTGCPQGIREKGSKILFDLILNEESDSAYQAIINHSKGK